MTEHEPPSLIKMVTSASKAAADYAASGFKTAPAEVHHARIATCAPCDQHDGTRCKVCGCFTDKKAWLPLEDCPLGKWPC